jgi:hypothetical protein
MLLCNLVMAILLPLLNRDLVSIARSDLNSLRLVLYLIITQLFFFVTGKYIFLNSIIDNLFFFLFVLYRDRTRDLLHYRRAFRPLRQIARCLLTKFLFIWFLTTKTISFP